MMEPFIHSPAFCCMLGGLTVPIVQQIEPGHTVENGIQSGFRLLPFLGSTLMYAAVGAIAGHIFFEDYAVSSKIRYFVTGLIAPIIINRMINSARDLLNRVKATEKLRPK
ncbi:hypothetical protein ACQKLP_10030 [Chitinophaga sp. NPDC101104]|uniref:hypothetical protein n=1 Tax=Chitinophaga sp. NPDC101104 TaxID=3390561 RepID=UPI003D03F20E